MMMNELEELEKNAIEAASIKMSSNINDQN
jgi:hypothetical protein